LLGDLETAIRASDLGLHPSNDGNVIRIPIPALTEERRRDMARMLHKLAEDGRIAIRHARQEANKEIKRAQQVNEIGEDEARRLTDDVQKLTDDYIGRIDQLLASKEQEVMEV
jgi:ribosome recycling factor